MAGTPRHESVEALLRAHPGERDPRLLVQKLARLRVSKAKRNGWAGPPFCPKELASVFDIRCKEVRHDIGGDGRLLLKRGKVWIEYHADRLRERQRFTMFHEFAHTLFPDYCEWLPLGQAATPAISAAEREFENLCDVGAAEMLFPRDEFIRDLQAHEFGMVACDGLRSQYGASIDATVRRMVEMVEGLACSAVFLTDVRGDREGDGPLWVKSIIRSASSKVFIWPGTTPPPNSATVACLKGEAIQPTREAWIIKGRPVNFTVQAQRLPEIPAAPEYPKVVALLIE